MTEDEEITDFIEQILNLAENSDIFIVGSACMSIATASAKELEIPLEDFLDSIREHWHDEQVERIH